MRDSEHTGKGKIYKITLMDGQELKERRNRLKLTQRQLSVLLNVTEDRVFRWERGKLPILTRKELEFEIIEARLSKRNHYWA